MPPKLSLKRIFDEAALAERTDIMSHRYIMRVCRKNGWERKTGVYNSQMPEHTEWPALLRTIANEIRLYEIYPELYIQPMNVWRVYRFLDRLFRYGQQNRDACWFRQLPPPPPVETVIVLTVDWDLSASVAVPPPPPPSQPVGAAGSMAINAQLALRDIQTSLDALPQQVADAVKAELDKRLGKCKSQVFRGRCDDHTEHSEKRTRR
ncbi:hypothetical protein FN846DRAFT_907848 [Sphaerosporella brunnea]|uniref:Uncharacterized protein n=1 Tax=Sphaerosporella brunnea TaxID=1250544 RepID=A0A5J5EUN6_9PEZI|nr:hypothetical protein FN846DRAFT_907848 [Sphaerosporella brunnea]